MPFTEVFFMYSPRKVLSHVDNILLQLTRIPFQNSLADKIADENKPLQSRPTENRSVQINLEYIFYFSSKK